MVAPDGGSGPSSIILSPAFKWVFVGVMLLTLISLGTSISLAVFVKNPSPEIKGLIETCSTTFKLGFGAVVGLIGGKTL